MSEMKPSQVITNTVQYTEYNLYLHGKIGEPDDFLEHFAVYKMANEGDIIRLYINSEGGSLSTGMEYIRHMKECNCPIIGVLGMEVASMASAIALECDEIELDEMTTMLVHSFSYGAVGTEASIYNQASFNKKLNERWIRKHYSNFLDENQIEDVFKGVDILLDSEDIAFRWEKLKMSREVSNDFQDEPEEQFNLLDEIKQAVQNGIKQGVAEIKKKYDLVPKQTKKENTNE